MKPLRKARPDAENTQAYLRATAWEYEQEIRLRIRLNPTRAWPVLQLALLTHHESMLEIVPVSAHVYARVVQMTIEHLHFSQYVHRYALLYQRLEKEMRGVDRKLREYRAMATAMNLDLMSPAEEAIWDEGRRHIQASLELVRQFCPDTS